MDDQQQAALWAKEILEKDNWCILDTETTGLGNAQIVQVGILSCTNSEGWQTLVKPTIPIEEGAKNVHGIGYDQVASAPYFDEIFIDLLKIIQGRDLVIYNAEFDLSMIRQSLRARGVHIAFPTSDRRKCRIFTNGGSIHDAMLYYSQWVGDWSEYHGNYKWQKLPYGDHSALGDCKAVLKIIQEMAAS
ncbi:3'-5' exonuclease [Calothrix sp. 336/3]|uniref:3'-5' exonuclease n=1 Tax=Calothrix sp. 336/3 TaxID=1337936 RepID=UPI0004E30DC9|nr:3'-5' exonuclease [Calothrix sp. 336/3]AKG21798.1 hypothetical protein IJ00_11495 [Calothrix sp. 336/3]